MNLKPNLWTLLFVIALAFIMYQNFSGNHDEGTSAHLTPCHDAQDAPDEIPDSLALKYIERYSDKYVVELSKDTTLAERTELVFPFVDLFVIPREDLLNAYCAFSQEIVYAVMAVKPGPVWAGQDTLDLIFTDVDLNDPHEGKFFDFTTPCPPLGDCKDKLSD